MNIKEVPQVKALDVLSPTKLRDTSKNFDDSLFRLRRRGLGAFTILRAAGVYFAATTPSTLGRGLEDAMSFPSPFGGGKKSEPVEGIGDTQNGMGGSAKGKEKKDKGKGRKVIEAVGGAVEEGVRRSGPHVNTDSEGKKYVKVAGGLLKIYW